MSFKYFLIISILFHLLFFATSFTEKVKSQPLIHMVSLKTGSKTSAKSSQGNVSKKEESNNSSTEIKDELVENILAIRLDYPQLAIRSKMEAQILVEITIQNGLIKDYKILPHNYHQVFNQTINQAMEKAKVQEKVRDGSYRVLIYFKLK